MIGKQKRIWSLLLCIAIVIAMLPTTAFAAGSVVNTEEELVAALASGGTGDVALGGDITGVTTQLTVDRSVTIDLNGHKLTVTLDSATGKNANGIKITSGYTLTVQDSSSPSSGELTVRNNATPPDYATDGNAAAINTTDGTLIIESGKVTAVSGRGAAGIGSGWDGYGAYTGGEVIIRGGIVIASGGWGGAGIGGGQYSAGGTVEITGGSVDATGGIGASGIGGGYQGSNGGTVKITGGVVNAKGGEQGAGIGGGRDGIGAAVEITGGTVTATATGAVEGASIGGGYGGASGGTLKITGGSVQVNNMVGGIAAAPKDAVGTALSPVTFTLRGSRPLANTALANTGHAIQTGGSNHAYGTQDVKTDASGKVYFWLPASTYDIALKSAGGDTYSNGSVVLPASGVAAILQGPTDETLLRRTAVNGGEYKLLSDFDGQAGNEPILTTELSVNNDVIIDLDGHKLTIALGTATYTNAIKIAAGKTLTIRDSSSPSTGRLTVTNGGFSGVAINNTGATLVIESGTVTATSGSAAAGIGGGYASDGGTVEIRGGIVTAISSNYGGAGIGGGSNNSGKGGAGGTVRISGGVVTAIGSDNGTGGGAGIGGGYSGDGGTVEISGGTVIATGGIGGTASGADIGSGSFTMNSGTLKITGGSVLANKTMLEYYSATPRAADGAPLSLVTLTVMDASALANTALADTGYITKVSGGGYAYGTKDLKTDASGKVYFWLPVDTYGITLKAGSVRFANDTVEVKADNTGSAELTVAPLDNTSPTLTAGSVDRTSDTAATVRFTSNEGGQYYYTVVDDNAGDPNIDTSGAGTFCGVTDVTLSLTLTAGAKDVWIYVKDAAGNIGKLKIDIDAYVLSILTGTSTIDNTSPRIGDTLTGSLVGSNNTGTLTYTWKTDGSQIGTGTSYTVAVADLGKTITLEITSSLEMGTVTSMATTAVAKKVAPPAPSAPTFSLKTHNSVTLTANASYEFSMDSTTWQTSNVFNGLTADTAYTFYQRTAATNDTEASAVSVKLDVMTDAAPVIGAIISPTSASYDLASPTDISTNITWNSANTVTDVIYATASMAMPTDYTVGSNILTIKDSYLSAQGFTAGSTADFTISFDEGNPATLTISIVNNHTPGSNADLSDLTVNDSTISGFLAAETSYSVELPYGTSPGSAAATVGASADDSKAGVSITQASSLPGSATVEVTAENGTSKKTYTINFTLKSAPPVQSDEKDVTSVITPTGAAITGTNISATMENSITSQVINLSVSAKASWKLYSDADCTSEITDKTMTLSVGSNTVYVRVTAEDSSIKDYTLTITRQGPAPSVNVTGISLNTTNLSLYSNTTPKAETLVATVSPGNAANKAVFWASSNSTIAMVDTNGKVAAMGNGTATITATTADGGFTAYCTVTVTTYTSGDGTGSGGGYVPTPPTSNVVTEKQPNMPTTAKTSIPGTVKDGILSANITEQMVKDAIKAAQHAAKKSRKEVDGIALDFNVADSGSYTSLNATIDTGAIDRLQEAGVKFFKIGTAVLDITLDAGAIVEIDNQSTGTVTVSAKLQTKLSDAAKKFIGNRPVFNITVEYQKNGKTETVSNFGKGAVTMGIAYKAAHLENTGNLFGVYVDKNGKPQLLTNSSYDNGRLIFSRNSLSTYGVGYKAPAPAFTDTVKHWAKDNIDFVASRDLISGTTETTFAPNTAITRADLLMALGKLSGADVSTFKTSSFTDVKTSDTTMPYIEWAVKNKIVSGYGNGKFGPSDLITREQMAVMMQNYAKATGHKLPTSIAAVIFADSAKISAYAKDAVKAIQQAGIIQGKRSNTFDPQGNATRGEASTILRRFVELVTAEGTARGWSQNDAGQWQYIGENGKAVIGWLNVENGKYQYYFNSNGIMVSSKWLQIDGTWYYFYADGSMAKNTKIDEYEVDANGVRKSK